MSGQVPRTLRYRHFEFGFGFGKSLGLHQRLAQDGVNLGLEIEQAERLSGGGDGVIEPPRPEVQAGQLGMNESVLGVPAQRVVEEFVGGILVAQIGECASYPQSDTDRKSVV